MICEGPEPPWSKAWYRENAPKKKRMEHLMTIVFRHGILGEILTPTWRKLKNLTCTNIVFFLIFVSDGWRKTIGSRLIFLTMKLMQGGPRADRDMGTPISRIYFTPVKPIYFRPFIQWDFQGPPRTWDPLW